jgi:hypothetical protein
MKKVLLFVTLLIGSVSFGQTISINGSLHSTNGDNTFPIWVEEGTTIQPNSPIKSISVKEFNVVPNSNGNDLVFNKTVLVYSDSISVVPEGKTWKLESIQNGLQLGDEYAGGIVFYLDGDGGGKVLAQNLITNTNWNGGFNYCEGLITNGFDDWYLPTTTDLLLIAMYNQNSKLGYNGNCWSGDNEINAWDYWFVDLDSWTVGGQHQDYLSLVIPIRQF